MMNVHIINGNSNQKMTVEKQTTRKPRATNKYTINTIVLTINPIILEDKFKSTTLKRSFSGKPLALI